MFDSAGKLLRTLYTTHFLVFQKIEIWQNGKKFCPTQWRGQPDIWSCKCKFFCVYRPYNESISKEMKNDNDLNSHLHDQIGRAGFATGPTITHI